MLTLSACTDGGMNNQGPAGRDASRPNAAMPQDSSDARSPASDGPAHPGDESDAGSSAASDAGVSADGGVLTDSGGADASTGTSTGPGDWAAGDYPPDLMAQDYLDISGVDGQKGNTRQYKVHVPPSYDPQTPTPLLFCIHGLGQNAVLFCVNGAEMHAKSDEEGFILVMPNGYMNSWNGGSCCGAASDERLDDVAFFRAILEEVGTHLNVDLDRVYATGLSNGGYMSYRLACEAADIFAAVAPGAGAIGTNDIGGGTNADADFTSCEPSRPVAVLDMHGTADGLVSYSLQAPTMELLQTHYGCDATIAMASQPESGGDTECSTYEGCPDDVELTACTVEGGGHCWFGSPDCGTGAGGLGSIIVGSNSDTLVATDAVWSFLSRFRR